MTQNQTSCFKVSDTQICPHCRTKKLIKNGFTKNKKQQFYCKNCQKRCIDFYTNKAWNPDTNAKIILFTKEGLGIRSTARVLKISTTTLLKRIITIAKSIPPPQIALGKTYEVDEMCTFIRSKQKLLWIVYALERETRKVVSLNIGSRTKITLNSVIKTLKFSQATKIFTDGLKHYKFLIDRKIHKIKRFGTNHIERKNLSVRTHVKRLNRRTICYSKSQLVLMSILKIYFFI